MLFEFLIGVTIALAVFAVKAAIVAVIALASLYAARRAKVL